MAARQLKLAMHSHENERMMIIVERVVPAGAFAAARTVSILAVESTLPEPTMGRSCGIRGLSPPSSDGISWMGEGCLSLDCPARLI